MAGVAARVRVAVRRGRWPDAPGALPGHRLACRRPGSGQPVGVGANRHGHGGPPVQLHHPCQRHRRVPPERIPPGTRGGERAGCRRGRVRGVRGPIPADVSALGRDGGPRHPRGLHAVAGALGLGRGGTRRRGSQCPGAALACAHRHRARGGHRLAGAGDLRPDHRGHRATARWRRSVRDRGRARGRRSGRGDRPRRLLGRRAPRVDGIGRRSRRRIGALRARGRRHVCGRAARLPGRLRHDRVRDDH